MNIKDIIIPSPCSYKRCLVEKGIEQQRRQELEQQNTSVGPVLSMMFLSVGADDYDLRRPQALETAWITGFRVPASSSTSTCKPLCLNVDV